MAEYNQEGDIIKGHWAAEEDKQLKQLVDERHCSLAEAKKKLDAKDSATPTITRSVDDEDSGWNAVICDFIDKRRQVNRATMTMFNISPNLSAISRLVTLFGLKPLEFQLVNPNGMNAVLNVYLSLIHI